LRRVRPEDSTAPPLKLVSLPGARRSPETLSIDGACCLRCPDEPCLRFSTVESGGGNTIQVCPVDAIHHARQELGPTVSDKCIECGLCVMRCPVGALALSEDGVVVSPPSPALTTPAVDEASFFSARDAQETTVNWDDREWAKLATRLTEAATTHKQDAFYGLVANLFTAAGHPAWRPARGDTSNRVDLILIDDSDSLPVEVKSRAESPIINVKSVQQALENRVVMDQRDFAVTDPDSSTLVVGYAYPPVRSDVTELIEDIAVAFGVNVGLVSLNDLYRLALSALLAGEKPSRRLLSELKGRLS
jgi:Fe-S-cluster-containing hydrogenase component 2